MPTAPPPLPSPLPPPAPPFFDGPDVPDALDPDSEAVFEEASPLLAVLLPLDLLPPLLLPLLLPPLLLVDALDDDTVMGMAE